MNGLFTDEKLKKKYADKKKSCSKRKIPLLLTLAEFSFLYKNHNMVCDYTGEKMDDVHASPNRITLERIDPTKPYELGNICFVTDKANQVKNAMFDHKEGLERITLKGKYRDTLFKLIDVMKDTDFIEKLKFKYSKTNVGKMMEEGTMTVDTPIKDQEPVSHNLELDIAKAYFKFGGYVEQQLKVDFNVTYGQFKQLCTKKCCMLTKRNLLENIYDLGFFILDKSTNVTKDNILVTTKQIQEALDKLQEDVKLTKEEIINMVKVLAK